jgi:tetratricopeptide (TPR) repeat protein
MCADDRTEQNETLKKASAWKEEYLASEESIRDAFRSVEGYILLNMNDDALMEIEHLLERDPENPRALYLRGLLLLNEGRVMSIEEDPTAKAKYEMAETSFRKLLALEPGRTEAYIHLAYIYRRLRGLDAAIEILEEGLGMGGSDETRISLPLANYNLACYYSQKGNTDCAMRHLTTAIEMDGQYKKVARDDEDFNPIRGNPGFQDLVEPSGKTE